METFHFDVNGMTCGGCVGSVQRSLSSLDGVRQVSVTLKPGSATVEADPMRVSADDMRNMLAKLGFEARVRPTGIGSSAT